MDDRVAPHRDRGAPVPQEPGRPRHRRHHQLGVRARSASTDIEHFAEFTGDTFYAHTDEEAAAKNPLFGGIVAHGYLIVSLAAGLFVEPNPGPVLANFGVDNLRFLTPVKAGDSIAVTLTVKQITPRTSADYGEVRWDARGHQRRGQARRDVRRADAGREDLAAGGVTGAHVTRSYGQQSACTALAQRP